MEILSEDHLKSLLSEEWLVKVDGQKSVPYLFKFHNSTMDLSCIVLITDTRSVWAEVLDSQKFARRWRNCNPTSPPPYSSRPDEDSWRESTLELLSNAHTLGGITDISFEVVNSNFSDFAFELESEHFKWRWETVFSGYRQSAEIISKQLILPLISLNHISLSSPGALSGMSDVDVEQAVDKVGRTARRAVDNHIRIALSKPRTATILRRITALFNFTPNIPSIFSTAEKPDLEPKYVERQPAPAPSTDWRKNASVQNLRIPPPSPDPIRAATPPPVVISKGKVPANDSETEDDDDDNDDKVKDARVPLAPSPQAKKKQPSRASPVEEEREDQRGFREKQQEQHDSVMRSVSPSRTAAAGAETGLRRTPPPAPEGSGSSNPTSGAKKKPRLAVSSSDSDSDARAGSQGPAATTTAVKRGARQPVKRGGKRF